MVIPHSSELNTYTSEIFDSDLKTTKMSLHFYFPSFIAFYSNWYCVHISVCH